MCSLISQSPSIPIGRLRKKIVRQGSQWTMTPPMNGPSNGPISAGITTKFMAASISDFGKVRTSASRPTGVIIAPPMPWMTREATNMCVLTDNPHASDPIVKSATAHVNTRLVPNRSAIQPLMGMKTARHNV
jgi:hypothetical protein